VAADCLNWDPVYCFSLTAYCVLSLVNIGLLSYVIYHYSKSQLEGSFFKKVKAWILMLCIIIYWIEFVRNFVGDVMYWVVSLWLLYLEQLTMFAVATLICYFFITAASKLVGKDRVKRWEKGFLILMVVAYGMFIVEIIIILSNGEINYLCHTNEFWIQDALLLVVLLSFIYAAKVISNIILKEMEAAIMIES